MASDPRVSTSVAGRATSLSAQASTMQPHSVQRAHIGPHFTGVGTYHNDTAHVQTPFPLSGTVRQASYQPASHRQLSHHTGTTGMYSSHAASHTTTTGGIHHAVTPVTRSSRPTFQTSATAHLSDAILPEGAVEVNERKVSSVVIHEGPVDETRKQEHVRYVEVPVYQEVVKEVKKKETRHVEKRVPKYEVEVVEKVVEVPQIEWIDKHVEVPRTETIIKHVPKIEVVDRNIDVVKHIPIIEFKEVEKIVEVPNGEVIEVPKPYTVEDKRVTDVNIDTKVPVVIAQSIRPVIKESHKKLDVEVYEYEPEVIRVDVHVAKPVDAQLVARGVVDTRHRVVAAPAAQYNALLRHMNGHLNTDRVGKLPYVVEDGRTPFYEEELRYHELGHDVRVEGFEQRHQHAERHVAPSHANSTTSSSTSATSTSFTSTVDPRTAQIVTTRKSRNHCGREKTTTTRKVKGGCCAPEVKVVDKSHRKQQACGGRTLEHAEHHKVRTRKGGPCYKGPQPTESFYDVSKLQAQ